MQYIVHRHFDKRAICGDVDFPVLTVCENINGMLTLNGKQICSVTSENAHQYFARNDDGNGIQRGCLTQRIIKTLSKRDDDYQKRWNKVWEDERCRKYKRREFDDFWLWNHAFYNASIEDLTYIAELVNA